MQLSESFLFPSTDLTEKNQTYSYQEKFQTFGTERYSDVQELR
jgi:hypothetical protein